MAVHPTQVSRRRASWREPNMLKSVSTSLQRIDKARTGSPGPWEEPMSKKRDVQGILTEVRSDIECVVMAARQLPPDEGGPIAAVADAAGKKIEEALRLLGTEVAASHGAKEG
jgi:hypothetical protein